MKIGTLSSVRSKRKKTALPGVSVGLANGTVLAQEGGSFNLPTAGPTIVRFGAGSQWAQSTLNGPGPITCTVNNFGGVDPAEGVAKQCVVGPYTP